MDFRIATFLEAFRHVSKVAKKEIGFQWGRNVAVSLESILPQLKIQKANSQRDQSQHSIQCLCHASSLTVKDHGAMFDALGRTSTLAAT